MNRSEILEALKKLHQRIEFANDFSEDDRVRSDFILLELSRVIDGIESSAYDE